MAFAAEPFSRAASASVSAADPSGLASDATMSREMLAARTSSLSEFSAIWNLRNSTAGNSRK